jgi:hypothetical protein
MADNTPNDFGRCAMSALRVFQRGLVLALQCAARDRFVG